MNDMKNILCFGDSNTFGQHPQTGGRYDADERWTGLLQRALGPDYRVIEEGLNDRTTVFDDPVTLDRNGRKALPILLDTHKPLDLIIIMLGTNDVKPRLSATVNDIARGMQELCQLVKRHPFAPLYPVPEILVVCPAPIREGVERRALCSFDPTSVEKGRALSAKYEQVARDNGCAFFDAGTVAEASPLDYVHLTPESHQKLAGAFAKLIPGLLK